MGPINLYLADNGQLTQIFIVSPPAVNGQLSVKSSFNLIAHFWLVKIYSPVGRFAERAKSLMRPIDNGGAANFVAFCPIRR